MNMKIIFALFSFSVVSTLAHASANSGAPNLCPRFYCVAQSTGMDYQNMHPGYGYNDDLGLAKKEALQQCEQESGSCELATCVKNTGPVLHVPWACVSQW